MYKKSGIIVSLLILFITIFLVLLTNHIKKPSVKSSSKSEDSARKGIVTTIVPNFSVTTRPNGLIIDELPEPSSVCTEDIVILGKHLRVENNIIFYTITLKLHNSEVIYYVDEKGYNSIKVTDTVRVCYNIYENSKNNIFLQITDVSII